MISSIHQNAVPQWEVCLPKKNARNFLVLQQSYYYKEAIILIFHYCLFGILMIIKLFTTFCPFVFIRSTFTFSSKSLSFLRVLSFSVNNSSFFSSVVLLFKNCAKMILHFLAIVSTYFFFPPSISSLFAPYIIFLHFILRWNFRLSANRR